MPRVSWASPRLQFWVIIKIPLAICPFSFQRPYVEFTSYSAQQSINSHLHLPVYVGFIVHHSFLSSSSSYILNSLIKFFLFRVFDCFPQVEIVGDILSKLLHVYNFHFILASECHFD